MIEETTYHIDDEIINSLGLQHTTISISAPSSVRVRAYSFPTLEHVYIMEKDLYGNQMPEGSCFLAVQGKHGLIGRSMHVDKLRNYSVAEIKSIVQKIQEG
jgi:hypothetical protein